MKTNIKFLTIIYFLPISVHAAELTHNKQIQESTEYIPQVYIRYINNESPHSLKLIMNDNTIATIESHAEYLGKDIALPVHKVQSTDVDTFHRYDSPYIKVVDEHTGKALIEKWEFYRFYLKSTNDTLVYIWVNDRLGIAKAIRGLPKNDSYNIDIIFKGHNLKSDFEISRITE